MGRQQVNLSELGCLQVSVFGFGMYQMSGVEWEESYLIENYSSLPHLQKWIKLYVG